MELQVCKLRSVGRRAVSVGSRHSVAGQLQRVPIAGDGQCRGTVIVVVAEGTP